MTDPEGNIRRRTILGEQLEVSPDQIEGTEDSQSVFYFDVPG